MVCWVIITDQAVKSGWDCDSGVPATDWKYHSLQIPKHAGNECCVIAEICVWDASYLKMYVQDCVLHLTWRDLKLFHKHVFLRIVSPKVYSFRRSWWHSSLHTLTRVPFWSLLCLTRQNTLREVRDTCPALAWLVVLIHGRYQCSTCSLTVLNPPPLEPAFSRL